MKCPSESPLALYVEVRRPYVSRSLFKLYAPWYLLLSIAKAMEPMKWCESFIKRERLRSVVHM
jgi:hypothetical protein